MKFRERKNKGALSVLEETPIIDFTPDITSEEKLLIEEQSKNVDAPSEFRLTETRNKELIKDEQSTNKPVTVLLNKPVIELKTRNKPVTENRETRNVEVIKDKQSTNKPVTENGDLSLDKVSSFQRKILQTIFQEIQTNPFEKETRPLNIGQLGELLEITDGKGFESLRIVILRLEKSGFLIKTKVKTGRSGWTKYCLPNFMFDQLLKYTQIQKPVIKDEQSTNKPVIKPVTADLSMYVSSNLNSNYIHTQFPDLEKIGLKIEHVEKSVRTEQDIEQILTHFNHSLLNNEVRSKYKLPVLLSILNDEKKSWVSESYLSEINDELKRNDQRVAELEAIEKRRKEQELREKFNQFKLKNLNFIEEIKRKNQNFTTDLSIIENLGFAEWLEKQNEL